MLIVVVFLVNILILILDISLYEVKEDEEKVEEVVDMVVFIKIFLFYIGKKKEIEEILYV